MESFRQTKATWWSVTAYGDNILRLTNKDGVPTIVKCIYGGVEKCPTTGRDHYQGAIQCNTQCRASVILDWLPGSHIEKAQSSIALRKYAMKEETAVGEKSEWTNPDEYLTMDKALDKLAQHVPLNPPDDLTLFKHIVEWEYWEGVKKIIAQKPTLIGLYSQPQIYRAWIHTRSVWKERAKSIVLQPAQKEVSSGEELSDEENLYDQYKMPKRIFKVNRKRMYAKKKAAAKRGFASSTTLVNRSLKPFAQRYITKMKYSETYSLSLSNSYSQIMNLNSIWDPNRTGIGHQPYGRDTLDQIYNRYRVIACSYVINAISQTGDTVRVVALPSNELIASPYTVSELCENPRARWIVQNSGGNSQYLKGKVYIPSLMGRTKAQYMADDRFQATMDTSPQEAALLTIVTSNLVDIAVNTSITVTLEYTVELFDPKPLEQS